MGEDQRRLAGLVDEECRDCLGTGRDPTLSGDYEQRNYEYCLNCWGTGIVEVQREATR